MQWKSNTTQLESWETTKFWCFICIMTHKERFFISTFSFVSMTKSSHSSFVKRLSKKITGSLSTRKWNVGLCSGPANSGYCTLYLSFMGLHSVCGSCCTGSDHWRCLRAGNCCLDVPEMLNCACWSLPRVVWAFSDSESLQEDRIESSEELCHKS